MNAGPKYGSGRMTELKEEEVRNKSRATATRPSAAREKPDGKGVLASEDEDTQRPTKDVEAHSAQEEAHEEEEKVDRPGFDLGGSSGKTSAGKGLGLGDDAKTNRKDWALPRQKS